MQPNDTQRRLFRELVDTGRRRFGSEDWVSRMTAYREKPNAFAHAVLGSRWWSAQQEVAASLARHRRVLVRSGHGLGKTYLAADLALWFLYTNHPAVVLTTAPTARQVEQVLWAEIHRRFYNAKHRLPGRLLRTRLDLGGGSFALGFSTESRARGVKLQGFHGPNILIVLDEASGIPDDIWTAAEGIAVAGNNKILAIGNPLTASGRFYELFRANRGWHKCTISALDHPNITGKGKSIPGGITADYIADKLTEWCEEAPSSMEVGKYGSMGVTPENGAVTSHTPHTSQTPDLFTWNKKTYIVSDLFRTRVLGEFPRSEDSSLIPLAWIEAARERTLPATGPRCLAADVARFGDDWTIIGLRQGPVLLNLWPIKGADTTAVAGMIERLAYDEHPSSIAVDSIGIGAGVVDQLVLQEVQGLRPINVGSAPLNPELFANLRAELYWNLRERFRTGSIVLTNDEQLAEELAAIRYRFNPGGKIQIESKDEMKRRLRRSPDRADMLALLFDSSGEWLPANTNESRIESPATLLRSEMRGW
jgi:phage terminase large subunit